MVTTYGWRGGDPKSMLIVPTDTIVRVSATNDITVFVTERGKLYIGKYNGQDRGSLQEVPVNCYVVDAVLYKGELVYVTNNGDVYAKGLDDSAVRSWSVVEPKKTCSHGKEERGRKVQIRAVSAGVDHILFVSHEGELWVQGKGPALGLVTNKTEHEISNPVRVDYFCGRKILQACAGAYFTVALVEALPKFNQESQNGQDTVPDFTSYVRSCDLCWKESGCQPFPLKDEEHLKCPLGLPLKSDCCNQEKKCGRLSPTPSSTNIDGHSSRNSPFLEDGESSECSHEDNNASESNSHAGAVCESGEKRSCERNCEQSSSLIDGSEFEIIEYNHNDKNVFDEEKTEVGGSGHIFKNADAARQFIARQLSWMTTNSLSEENAPLGTGEKSSIYKYPIDATTDMIKENVASVASSAANFVSTGVRTVSDKVGQLSRHFSSSEYVDEEMEDVESISFHADLGLHSSAPTSLKKSDSFQCNSLPRTKSSMLPSVTHTRTGSGTFKYPRANPDTSLILEKSQEQIEHCRKLLIERGESVISTEVWAWGSAKDGQLGLGDNSHRSTPILIKALSCQGITKISTGTHHAVALTIDGKLFAWGNNANGQLGVSNVASFSSPQEILLPERKIARDVSSGDSFLILVTVDGSLYYVAKTGVDNNSMLKKLEVGDVGTWFHSVMCDCESIVSTTLEVNHQVVEFLQQEMQYFSCLKCISEHAVKPLLMHVVPTPTSDASSVNRARYSLLEGFRSLYFLVSSGVSDLLSSSLTDPAEVMPISHQVLEYESVYTYYVKAVCDALAIGALLFGPKELTNTVEKCIENCSIFVPSDIPKQPNDILSYLFMLPLKRLEEYQSILSNMLSNPGSYISPFSMEKLRQSFYCWKSVSCSTHKSKLDAEATKYFWDNCHHAKMGEALATPSRRLLLESRTNRISVYNAGRFSSHSFILFTDVLVHVQYSSFATYYLETLWVETAPNSSNIQNGLQLIMPEDTLTLVCRSAADKSQWLYNIQESIKSVIRQTAEEPLPRSPPLVRQASYQFTKHLLYKDATYTGQWVCGKLHGKGVMTWPDGRKYCGYFHHNAYHGPGCLEVPSGSGSTTYEGTFKHGKLEGKGVIKYANSDIYSGCVHESLPEGHGQLKKGCFSSHVASVYIGEWVAGVKEGYGVLDDIRQGEKYLGLWHNNNRHGPGLVVTMNGVYYEGNFNQNKLMGFGLMIYDDGTYFEGELGPRGSFAGKGILRYPSGDFVEGTFSGTWTEGVKVNGILYKGIEPSLQEKEKPSSFGKLSVNPDKKWCALFKFCEDQLCIGSEQPASTAKVWERVAACLEEEKQSFLKLNKPIESLEGLDRIPDFSQSLTYSSFKYIQDYLERAFSSRLHPLGQLLHSVTDAFRATYGGVVAHPRLLSYAVAEVGSLTSRLYAIVQYLFPSLPSEGCSILLESPQPDGTDEVVVTESSVIQPYLLPHVYSPLSTLYVLHCHQNDEEYWQRLLKWNKQSDIALMTFLGVDTKFWIPPGENMLECSRNLSSRQDCHFTEAIETLQMLSTSFSPQNKLKIIHKTFQKINSVVSERLDSQFLWTMDDLFPVFQYVVVRSRIQHLGAEIRFVEDLLDPYIQNGEIGIMFTTLQACYYQIQNEKATFIV